MLHESGKVGFRADLDLELFKFARRTPYVGNVMWDRFEFPPVYACMLATFLSGLPHWGKTVWQEPFGEAWDKKSFDSAWFLVEDKWMNAPGGPYQDDV
jgi:hypothetical protein